MLLYIKNPKDSTKKLLELIHQFSKVAGYKKLISRNQLNFYMPIMNYQKGKLRKQSHSQLLQNNKLSRNIPKQGVKDLYLENCKTLKKEIEEDTNKWKHIPCSWIG